MRSHGINGLETHFLPLHWNPTDGLAGEAQTAPDQRKLLLGIDLGVQLLLEVAHAEHRVPVAQVNVVLLDVGQLIQQSSQKGSHLLVELLHLQLHYVLIGVLNQLLADLLLALVHPLQHLFVLPLGILVVKLVILLVGVSRPQVLLVHVGQEVGKGFLGPVAGFLADLRVTVSVVLVVAAGSVKEALDAFVAEGILEEVICFLLLHVPGGDFEPELLVLQAVHDVLVEVAKDAHQIVVGGVSFFKLPVGHLHAHFLAGDLHSCLVEEIEEAYEVLLAALAQVVGMDPNGSQFLSLEGWFQCCAYALDGAVVDIEPVEDDLEGGELGALSHCVDKVLHEVLEHAVLVVGEVAVATAFERQLHEGWSVRWDLQGGHFVLEVPVVFVGEEIAVALVALIQLHHEINLKIQYEWQIFQEETDGCGDCIWKDRSAYDHY